jgi:ABC-2 type transport system permease protein
MIAFIGNIKKELLLLFRDKSGLSFLFLMPIVLVVLMTLLQDKTTKKLQQEQLDIAVVNLDHGIMADAIIEGLGQMKIFNLHMVYQNDTLNEESIKEAVNQGVFQMGLIIPKKASVHTKRIIANEIRKQLPSPGTQVLADSLLANVALEIFYDPIIKGSLRTATQSAINQLMANVQTMIVFKSYTKTLEKITGRINNSDFPISKFTSLETNANNNSEKKIPNSTQHNVPAWTVFAIFFMVIPLATQIISEREEGSIIRLKLSPTPFYKHFLSRILVYTLLAVIQATTLLLIGQYLLPSMGMSPFDIHGEYFSFIGFTIFIGMAASSYGIAVGNIAKTHHQASIFGSISIVLLAAIGGIWVPTYMMPNSMLSIAQLSPLNWALEGYYNIVLKAHNLSQLITPIIKLILFFAISLTLAVIFGKRKNI